MIDITAWARMQTYENKANFAKVLLNLSLQLCAG